MYTILYLKSRQLILTEKYSKKRVTPDVVEGIIAGGQELDGRFTSEPRYYGACEVSGNEKQALSLPLSLRYIQRLTVCLWRRR